MLHFAPICTPCCMLLGNKSPNVFCSMIAEAYIAREHMNPQLTYCQRQWLHSSVGRASHRCREVTGSNPVEVLNFFRLLYAIALLCFTVTIIPSFQCWIHLHSSSNNVETMHAHYSWSPKSYGLYPSHNTLQIPTLMGVVASVCSPL